MTQSGNLGQWTADSPHLLPRKMIGGPLAPHVFPRIHVNATWLLLLCIRVGLALVHADPRST